MKIFILATVLFASIAFADVHLEIAEVKGEVDAAAPVIDNEENAANDVRGTVTNTGEENASEINGQLEMLSPNLEETENGFGNDLDNGSTKAQDYNSSRSNKSDRGVAGNGATGQARRRGDVALGDVTCSNTKAQDYNSSRCNRRGVSANDHNSTRSNRGRRLDTDDDDDGVDTEVCDAVDNDCDSEVKEVVRRQH